MGQPQIDKANNLQNVKKELPTEQSASVGPPGCWWYR